MKAFDSFLFPESFVYIPFELFYFTGIISPSENFDKWERGDTSVVIMEL